ncbi:MAG: DUF1835 domain-containing protein [Pyrinomonadaceae bacterium]
MIYQVMPGDSVAAEFRKTGIGGEVVVCRECLVVGPVDAETPFEFWEDRAKFILAEYGEDEIEFHERVADELEKLADLRADDEINLWFEYELFCSVNMWFCLSLLKDSGGAVYRVEPIGLNEADRWDGFGKFKADDLKACFELRTEFSKDDIALGDALWEAYRKKDIDTLKELGETESPCFPHLKEVVAAAVTQSVQPIETLKAIVSGGETDFGKVFVEFKKRAGVYGYGDLQVQRLLDHMSE